MTSARLIGLTFPTMEDMGRYEPLDIIEYAGRVDYGPASLSKMGDKSIIKRWIASGEESMLEMVNAVFLIECSRVVSHELVRHRIASYQQESQRYVKYDDAKPEDLFYVPDGLSEDQRAIVEDAYLKALEAYKLLKSTGAKSQLARYVLPNGTKTRIVANMNLREWRHVLKLRMHTSAQPEMRVIAAAIFNTLNDEFPEVFGDIPDWLDAGERGVR